MRPLLIGLCALAPTIGAPQTPDRPVTFEANVAYVQDGDTLRATLATNPRFEFRIRLYGIDAPEKGQAYGEASKKALSDLISGKTVRVTQVGTDQYQRVIAWIRVWSPSGTEPINVNEKMVRQGFAWWYDRRAPKDTALKEAQEKAKEEKAGLWKDPIPTPPWNFRRP